MTDIDRDKEFQARIRKELDAGLSGLDPDVERRLLEGRRKALDRADSRWPDWLRVPRLLPVTGFATLAVMIAAVSLWYAARPQMAANKIEELEVLTIASSLDMYKDLEMLQWLAEDDEAG